MCNPNEVAATLRGSPELQLRIVRSIGSFTVALFAMSDSSQGEHLEPAGTGTLFAYGGSHYILTAAHVWEKVVKSARVGITLTDDIDHRFPIDVKTITPCGPPKPAAWDEWGPDMIFLRVPSEHLGSINAYRVFYDPTIDGRTALNVDHVEVWVLMGTPEVLGKFTQAHADVEIRGFFVNTDAPSQTRGDFDYLDVGVDTSFSRTPQSLGGVSGGGLWKVLIYCPCSKGKIDWVQSLEGVAFWEFPPEKGRGLIRCHGPRSINAAVALL